MLDPYRLMYNANRGICPVPGWKFDRHYKMIPMESQMIQEILPLKGRSVQGYGFFERINNELHYNDDDEKIITEEDLQDLSYKELNSLNEKRIMEKKDNEVLERYINKIKLETIEEDKMLMTERGQLLNEKEKLQEQKILKDIEERRIEKEVQEDLGKEIIDELFDYYESKEDLEALEAEKDFIQDSIKEISTIRKSKGLDGGYGKTFEDFIRLIINDDIVNLTGDDSPLENNDYNPRIPDNKKNFTVYDLSNDNNDIEAKNYNSGGKRISPENDFKEYENMKDELKDLYSETELENELKKFIPFIPIQKTKFGLGNSEFNPLFSKNDNEIKLYNIKTNFGYVNPTFNKNLYFIVNTIDGIYYYEPLKDKDIQFKRYINLKGDNGENLYQMKINYTTDKDDYGKPVFKIPLTKFKKMKII